MANVTYRAPAQLGTCGGVTVWVVAENGGQKELPHVVRHSPDGFQWGYAGSGPSDLALSILVHYLRWVCEFTPEHALTEANCWYQAFKHDFIAVVDRDGPLEISSERITEWYDEKLSPALV